MLHVKNVCRWEWEWLAPTGPPVLITNIDSQHVDMAADLAGNVYLCRVVSL
jgi:hypothetical protein